MADASPKCPDCHAEMKPLWGTKFFCPNDCDKRPAKSPAAAVPPWPANSQPGDGWLVYNGATPVSVPSGWKPIATFDDEDTKPDVSLRSAHLHVTVVTTITTVGRVQWVHLERKGDRGWNLHRVLVADLDIRAISNSGVYATVAFPDGDKRAVYLAHDRLR